MIISTTKYEQITTKDIDAKFEEKIKKEMGEGEITILSRTATDCHFVRESSLFRIYTKDRETVIEEITEGVFQDDHRNAFVGEALEQMVEDVLEGKCNQLHLLVPLVNREDKYFIEEVTTPLVENVLGSMDWKDEYYPEQDKIRKALHGKNMQIRGNFDTIKSKYEGSLSESVKNNLDLIANFVQNIRERFVAKQNSAVKEEENRGQEDSIMPMLNALSDFVHHSRKLAVSKNLQSINEAMVSIRDSLKDFNIFVEYKLLLRNEV